MAGVYGVYAIKNGAVSGCDTSATESTNVVINTRPASQSLNVSRSLTFCGNDSVILSTTNTAGHKYRWLKNGINTGNNADTLFGLIVKTSGTYNVRVTNTNGCANTMRDTVVTANPKPNTSTITGSASVQVNSSQNYSVSNTAGSTYNWSVQLGTQTTGGNTNAIGVTWGASSGTGTVKVIETNSSGCKGDTVSKAVTINAIVADSLTLGNDTVKFVSTGGTKNVTLNSNRSWAVSNTAGWLSISPMSGSNNGTLQLTATSNTGAQRSTTVSVTAGSNTKTIVVVQDGFVGLEEAEREKTIQVYPNPTEGKVTISGVSAAQHITIRMMDMTGKILSEEKCMDGTTLDYSNYANGIYLLQLNKADKISYIKLWIAHP
jgi:hypothetical protein